MNYDKILENFLDDVQGEGTYATREELEAATKPMLEIIQKKPDATPEELEIDPAYGPAGLISVIILAYFLL